MADFAAQANEIVVVIAVASATVFGVCVGMLLARTRPLLRLAAGTTRGKKVLVFGAFAMAGVSLASVLSAVSNSNTNSNISLGQHPTQVAMNGDVEVEKLRNGPFASAAAGSVGKSDINALNAYLSAQPNPAMQSLPGVDTMIGRLEKRLEKSANDVEGWRMLGWSYFHQRHYEKAVGAYERALVLDPKSGALQTALREAKHALSQPTKQELPGASSQTPPSKPSAPGSATP